MELTKKDINILTALAEGLTQEQISKKAKIPLSTLRLRLTALRAAFGAKNYIHLAVKALREKVIK